MKKYIPLAATIQAAVVMFAACGRLAMQPETPQRLTVAEPETAEYPFFAISQSKPVPPENVLPEDENGNFSLRIGNASDTITAVDIVVHIDGKIAVNDCFERETQWNHFPGQGFRFSLSEGTHTLVVESLRGGAKLEREFGVKGKLWAYITYQYRLWPETGEVRTARQFIFTVSDTGLVY